MKAFTSLMIAILLILCHYVDRLSPEGEETLTIEVKKENFKLIEYENDQIDHFRIDTVYYSYKKSKLTDPYKTMNLNLE